MPFVNTGTSTFSFALKGSKCRKVFGAHARGELTIKGSFHVQGPQPVDDDGGAPVWVADFFDNNQDVDQIALSGKDHSVVYARISDNNAIHADGEGRGDSQDWTEEDELAETEGLYRR